MTPATVAEWTVTVAELGGEVVGLYATSTGDDDRHGLEHLWVVSGAMGNGVGSRLFRHAVDAVRERGGGELAIASDPDAVGFYERQGAVVVGHVRSSAVEGRTLPHLVCALDDCVCGPGLSNVPYKRKFTLDS